MESLSWQIKASCIGSGLDFFKENETKPLNEVCLSCPVQNECYQHALYNEIYGFWAGTTGKMRKALRKQLGIPTPESTGFVVERERIPIKHGTRNGYSRHVKLGVPFEINGVDCGCREANRIFMAEYRTKKKGTAA